MPTNARFAPYCPLIKRCNNVVQVLQDLALQLCGIPSPHTLAIVGRAHLAAKLKEFIATTNAGRVAAMQLPLLLKHNRGGSGAGVRIFTSYESALEVSCMHV